jgi:hypothetical protein
MRVKNVYLDPNDGAILFCIFYASKSSLLDSHEQPSTHHVQFEEILDFRLTEAALDQPFGEFPLVLILKWMPRSNSPSPVMLTLTFMSSLESSY